MFEHSSNTLLVGCGSTPYRKTPCLNMSEPDIPSAAEFMPYMPDVLPDLFRRALMGEVVPADTPGMEVLARLKVLQVDALGPGQHRIIHPAKSRQKVRIQGMRDLSAIANSYTFVGTLFDSLEQAYAEEGFGGPSDLVEHLEGPEINARIEDVVNMAEFEILTMQPGGPRTREKLDRSLPRDTAALERGVKIKTLYHSTARTGQDTQSWARTMGLLGGEIRTLDAPLVRLIIVDRKHAFLQDVTDRDDDKPENYWAHQVNDKAVVAFLVELFDHKWIRADNWHGSAPEMEDPALTPQIMSILDLLGTGYTQAQAAAKLGMADRTLQKHLTKLKETYPHLTTPAAMTFWWATHPEREKRK